MVALRRIVRMLRLADREAEISYGVSAAQLFVLAQLAREPANSVAELADRTSTDQSSVSTVVAKLVVRRLVTRKPSRHDRRRAELRLTPLGETVVRKAPRVPQKLIVEAVHAMPPRARVELVRSLNRLVTAIGANELPPKMLFEDEPPGSRSRAR